MKTLLRILIFFVLLILVVVGIGYFMVTRPAFQKKLIESNLPAGSSIAYVKISTGSLELTDLKLQMPDGTSAKLDSLRSDFSPWAAIFDNTITLRGLSLEGLVVKLPEASEAPGAGESAATAPSASSDASAGSDQSGDFTKGAASDASSPADALQALYAIGDLSWLFDVDSVHINGALIDAGRNRYSFDVKSDVIAPGADSTLTLAFKLESKKTLQGGLKDFVSDTRLHFTQKASGGFERLSLDSQTSGTDASGGTLLSSSQTLNFTVNAFEETAALDLSFTADLPHPEVFAPQLSALQGLSLKGALIGSAEGQALTLESADFDAASNGVSVANIQLKQSLTLGAQQKFAGELMDVNLVNLPLAWLNPWLPEGLQLSGAPLSAQIALSGESSGALQVKTRTPLEFGPLSLAQPSGPLLQEVTIRMDPVVRVEADQTIRYDLGDFALLDRSGAVVSGTLSGYKSASGDSKASTGASTTMSPLAGLQTQAKLEIGLAELLKQPVLAGMASVLAGQASVRLDIDGAAEHPAQLQVAITGLRARDLPGSRQDYRLAAQLKQTGNTGYALGAKLDAGSETRPSTSIQVTGQVDPELLPIPFNVNLSASRILQADLDLLMAALQADTTEPAPVATAPVPSVNNSSTNRSGSAAAAEQVQRPPWADLDGEVTVQIETLTLNSGQNLSSLSAEAKISEALLSVTGLKATLDEGRLAGDTHVRFDARQNAAYQLSASINFDNVNPAIFSKSPSGSFPVRGLFAGTFKLSGNGPTLEAAVNNSEGDLTITGRDGILTAFELDGRSQLGLIGAGLLGQSLDRPGITALAQAVPYFKDMPFDSFTLKLARGQDKIVRIPELLFVGDNLRINGQGSIAASQLSEAMKQPLDLTIGLAAKGRLIEYLETLQLLGPNTSADGFRSWNKDIKLSGTLADPDTSALKEMLNNAARRAISKPQSQTTPTTPTTDAEQGGSLPGEAAAEASTPVETKPKTREDRRRDDIEMGLDLLNSVLGQ